MLVKEQYRHLDKEGLIQKIYDVGSDYEKKSGSCSQSLVQAFHEVVGLEDSVVRCSSSSCAGLAGSGVGPCGALAGGLMVLDYFFGRESECMSMTDATPEVSDPLFEGLDVAYRYHTEFIKEFGTTQCNHIQMQRYGRMYFLRDQDEMDKFNATGAHEADDKCGDIVGTGAKIVMRMLIEEGAIEVAEGAVAAV